MNNLVSVIVPIYKVEPYLRQCVDSIISQTYKNLEIILVDDGSPDACPQICDEYAQRDNRVRVIHKLNEGLSSARNAGLDIATGDYIAFVDSDDWLESDMYRILLELLLRHDADVAECAHNSGTVKNVNNDSNDNIYTETVFEDYSSIVNNIVVEESIPDLRFEVWDKLFKRSIISDTRFKVGQIYEDLFFDRVILKRCNRLVYTNYIGYNYRVNREGSTVSFFNEKKLCKLSEIDEYIKEFEKEKKTDISKNFRVFGCASAIDLYHSSKKHAGSQISRNIIYNYFKYFASGIRPLPLSYRFFILSPSLYYLCRSLIKGMN